MPLIFYLWKYGGDKGGVKEKTHGDYFSWNILPVQKEYKNFEVQAQMYNYFLYLHGLKERTIFWRNTNKYHLALINSHKT